MSNSNDFSPNFGQLDERMRSLDLAADGMFGGPITDDTATLRRELGLL